MWRDSCEDPGSKLRFCLTCSMMVYSFFFIPDSSHLMTCMVFWTRSVFTDISACSPLILMTLNFNHTYFDTESMKVLLRWIFLLCSMMRILTLSIVAHPNLHQGMIVGLLNSLDFGAFKSFALCYTRRLVCVLAEWWASSHFYSSSSSSSSHATHHHRPSESNDLCRYPYP